MSYKITEGSKMPRQTIFIQNHVTKALQRALSLPSVVSVCPPPKPDTSDVQETEVEENEDQLHLALSSIPHQTVMTQLQCQICSVMFFHSSHLKQHLSKAHGVRRPRRRRIQTQNHPEKELALERPFKCDICGYALSTKPFLSRHMKVHTKEICCKYCGKGFSTLHAREYHMKFHTDESIYYCPLCNRKFMLNRTYLKHMEEHKVGSLVRCQECKKCYENETALARHIMDCHGPLENGRCVDGQFTCKLCGYNSPTLRKLKRHIREAHIYKDAFKCKFCEKRFNSLACVGLHEKTHTGEKYVKIRSTDPSVMVKNSKDRKKSKSTSKKSMFE